MFRFNGFTQKSSDAINLAIAKASALGHTYIGSEHLLLGLLAAEGSTAQVALNSKGLSADIVVALLIKTIGRGAQSNLTPNDITPCCRSILEGAVIRAKASNHVMIGTEHILMAMLAEKDSYAVKFLLELGVDIQSLNKILSSFVDDQQGLVNKPPKTPPKPSKPQSAKTPLLDKFSKDLTEMARGQKLDPVVGRDDEIERVIQILSRRSKNNPCLIGEAGVGKTAVIEGLAQQIVAGKVPAILLDRRVVSLDLTSIVAGTKYRGDFEERIKNIINEVITSKNIILFIDEIHNIMGTGAAEGAIDAANILKPQLARGELQLIGATTFEEYRKHIEKDSALERRFQSVKINEPSMQSTIAILHGLRERYESHHQIKISNEAIKCAVELSSRYIMDRFLPDKAIDLVDEACAYVKLRKFTSSERTEQIDEAMSLLKDELDICLAEKNFTKVLSLRESIRELENEKVKISQEIIESQPVLGKEDIARVVSKMTGIEVSALDNNQVTQLLELEEQLGQQIIGQKEAVAAVSRAIRRGRVGLKDPKRPIGSFVFLGPTGVGKTELSVALGQCLFGSNDSLIRLDMSEFMEKHSVSKLIGSPPGYVGHEEGGKLTEKIRRKPYSVVLFDEIEKAHPDVLTILLQILEDGQLTDSMGRSCSFKNAVIIMTSNIGARYITDKKSFGFSVTNSEDEVNNDTQKEVLKELRRLFRPELLNRIDEVVVFKRLNKENICEIASKLLDSVVLRMNDIGIQLGFTPEVVSSVSDWGYEADYGARPLRRAVQSKIEDFLADEILHGRITIGDTIICDCVDQKVTIHKVESLKEALTK